MSLFRACGIIAVAVLSVFSAPSAHSHITLQNQQAAIDGSYKAVLKVPHGCKGSPTVEIRIRIPEGVVDVRPQPKAGWSLQTVAGQYARSYDLHGMQVNRGVKEVIWAGGSLPDDYYDEFVFVGYLSSDLIPDSHLYFPVVQECERSTTHWIDMSSINKNTHHGHSGYPAPSLKLLPRR
ncbi:MAG: DUF1775 domain-containing protein [Candidimonas sp.]|jgi:uncharacterized protein YcnI